MFIHRLTINLSILTIYLSIQLIVYEISYLVFKHKLFVQLLKWPKDICMFARR